MPRLIDITGRTFGRLTVLERATPVGARAVRYRCQCSCGTVCVKNGGELRSGDTQSCGCLNREVTAARNKVLFTTHGKHESSTYHTREGMIQRCTNPLDKGYADYGGRGIKVCPRWLNSFEAFLQDLGERPEKLTLDRIDVNGHYEPGNCRWASLRQQMHNRRDSVGPERAARVIELRSAGHTLQSIADTIGVCAATVGRVLRYPQRYLSAGATA